jgi:hypothetical protein
MPVRHRDPAGPTRSARAGWHQLDRRRTRAVHARPLGHQPGPSLQHARGTAHPAPSDPDDHTQEIRLKDARGRLRFPAYLLIALGIALVAITVAIVAVLVGFT